MQENEFERRLQEEMGGFRLRPSEVVWEKVEEELKKKKKRRVVVFFFLLAGLSLLGYSGYFLLNTNSKQNPVQQAGNTLPGSKKSLAPGDQQTHSSIEHETTNDQPAIKEEKLSQIKDQKKEESGDIVNKEKAIVTADEILNRQKEKAKKTGSDNYAVAKSYVRNIAGVKRNSLPREKETRQNNNSSDHAPDKIAITAPDIPKNESRVAKTNLQDDNKAPTQQKNEAVKKDSAVATSEKAGEAIAGTKKRSSSSKIKLGFDFSAGRSYNRNSAFSLFDMQKSADMLYSNPANNAGGGGLGFYRINPSDINPGAAFRAGILAEMEITKRSSIVSGLQYAYQSNRISVGSYKDTTVTVFNSYSQNARVDAVYRGIHQKEYTNRYHFIQIPLQYQLQLNKGTKLPVCWNIGISAGYLFATNGLVYDTTAGGIYYHDKAAFNKFQLNLNTGFSLRFGSKNKIQWSVGPEISMATNKLMKDDYTRKQYLLYGGITGRLFFKKK